jgi:catechol 2,3-dioxygenase-like lactoylglutathione lyase family enzyme
MFTYFCLGTNNLQRAARFYDAALTPLGIHRCDGDFESDTGEMAASSWAQVDGFYTQALLHGGSSEGMPGLRPQYGPDFYAAYVRDPDGNKLAAVCRGLTAKEPGDASR